MHKLHIFLTKTYFWYLPLRLCWYSLWPCNGDTTYCNHVEDAPSWVKCVSNICFTQLLDQHSGLFLLIRSNQFSIRLPSFIVSTNNLTFTLVKGKQSTMTWTTNIWPNQPWPCNPAPSVIMVWSCIPKKFYMVHKYNIETRFRGKLIVFFKTYMYEQIYWQILRSWRSHLLSCAAITDQINH